MAEKRYYWLKLQKDFFKRNDIQIVESMPNGKDYILFYLKLLCESTDSEGVLRFSETIPYSPEMLATITNTNVDIVRSAIKVFQELGMIEVLDDGTYYMAEVNKMLGSETEWAKKKREYRKKISIVGNSEQLLKTKEDNVLPLSDKSKSIEKEIDIEIDIEKDIDKEYVRDKSLTQLLLNDGTWYEVPTDFVEELKNAYPNVDVESELSKMRVWCLSNVSKRKTRRGIKRFINSWISNSAEKTESQNEKQNPYSTMKVY